MKRYQTEPSVAAQLLESLVASRVASTRVPVSDSGGSTTVALARLSLDGAAAQADGVTANVALTTTSAATR